MTTCSRCAAPLKDGALTCPVCGQLVVAPPAAASAAATEAAARRRRRLRRGVAAAAAVVAALVVWQVVVRGPATTGDEFVGQWRSQSMQSIGSAAVSHYGDDFQVLLTSGQTGQQARVTAHLDGGDLVITPDDFEALGDPNTGKLKLLLALAAGDFRITLSSVDATHLRLKLQGTSPAGKTVDERTTLERATTPPSPA